MMLITMNYSKFTKHLKIMNVVKLPLAVMSVVLGALCNLQAAIFSEPFDYQVSSNINTGTNASKNGWWACSNPDNIRIDNLNSPFINPGVANTGSVRIYRLDGNGGEGSLYNTFVGSTNAQASVGYGFNSINQPKNLGFIWDIRNHAYANGSNRPHIFIGEGMTAVDAARSAIRISLNNTFDAFTINGWTGAAPVYAPNTWYRFEILNVNVAKQTYDLNIYSEVNLDTPYFSETGLPFANMIFSLDAIRFNFVFAGTNNRSYWIDNFTILTSDD